MKNILIVLGLAMVSGGIVVAPLAGGLAEYQGAADAFFIFGFVGVFVAMFGGLVAGFAEFGIKG